MALHTSQVPECYSSHRAAFKGGYQAGRAGANRPWGPLTEGSIADSFDTGVWLGRNESPEIVNRPEYAAKWYIDEPGSCFDYQHLSGDLPAILSAARTMKRRGYYLVSVRRYA